jgi:NTP pyrophosphatase (non-canonical NTP hydrolase)
MSEQRTSEHHFNGLSPEHAESLALLAEECAEVIQIITKIQRHGMYSHHPVSNEQNWTTLQKEMGDVLAAARIAETYKLLDWSRVITARDRKLAKVGQYLHHAEVGHE